MDHKASLYQDEYAHLSGLDLLNTWNEQCKWNDDHIDFDRLQL